MAKFSGLDKLSVKNNLIDRLAEAQNAITRAQRLATVADDLSEITNDIGSVNSGQLLAITANDPTDVDANGAFFDCDGILFSDGNLYHVGGVSNGRLMFGLRAEDGAGVFAGGQGVIDNNGLTLTGIRYALEHTATDPDGLNPRRARMEMIYPEGSTIPALNLSFIDATDYPELVTNGSLETGDDTGWAATFGADANATFTVEAYEGGDSGYAGKLERTASNGTMYVDSTAFAVTALTNYAVNGAMAVEATGYTQGQITLRWLNSSSSLISEVLLANTAKAAGESSPLTAFSRTVKAPAGAVTAIIRVIRVGFVGVVWFDEISVKFTSIVHNITIGDNGASLLEWGASVTDGVDQNNSVSSTSYDQTLMLNVRNGVKITALAWDIRNTGDYVLRHCWSRSRLDSYNSAGIWSGTVAAAGENTLVLPEPLVLPAGTHYLTLVRPAGVVTWWDTDLPRYVASDASFGIGEVSYNGTTAARIAPVKLNYHPGAWS